jgi:ApaG protein
MYDATTHSIRVSVEPLYLEDQSAPEDDYYVWSYKVVIENQGGNTVQVRNRLWRIVDSDGRTQEVHGEGVVGEQPVLGPGDRFEYTSGAPLNTPSGIMGGVYQVTTDDGLLLDVTIPPFSLDSPYANRTVN